MKIEMSNQMFNYSNVNQPNNLNSIDNTSKQNSVLQNIADNIQQKGDMLTLSKDAKLKLQLRNLKKVNKLEKKSDELKKKIEDKLNLLQDVYDTLGSVRDLIKESMKELTSDSKKKDLQQKIDDIWKDIKDTVLTVLDKEEQSLNNKTQDIAEDQVASEALKTDKGLKGSDSDASLVENANEDDNLDTKNSPDSKNKEDQINTDFNSLDIINSPFKALKLIDKAKELILKEISELGMELGKTQEEIDKLLGRYVPKKKTMETTDENNAVEDKEDTKKQTSAPVE